MPAERASQQPVPFSGSHSRLSGCHPAACRCLAANAFLKDRLGPGYGARLVGVKDMPKGEARWRLLHSPLQGCGQRAAAGTSQLQPHLLPPTTGSLTLHCIRLPLAFLNSPAGASRLSLDFSSLLGPLFSMWLLQVAGHAAIVAPLLLLPLLPLLPPLPQPSWPSLPVLPTPSSHPVPYLPISSKPNLLQRLQPTRSSSCRWVCTRWSARRSSTCG